MNLDWQNIVALVIVLLAAFGLMILLGIFRKKPLHPHNPGCRACHGCPKNDCLEQVPLHRSNRPN